MNKLAALLTLMLALTGCDTVPSKPAAISLDRYIELTYAATDQLIAQLGQVNKAEPILVATLVSIDELESASRLGRSISEQVAGRLTQKGFKVVEVKLRGNLFVKRSEGEMLLSREVTQISQSYQAPTVVVGTYAPASDFVAVSLKVVSAASQLALAATDYGLPLDANTKMMLSSGR